ncbi:MAM domain protein [Onchocerca flexuosa]|uniref:MAM domain protein n=1 Tax=Onchocerca flexuosa TaxID=387005 RepID=A0A238BZM8_9BILA|nr:MAM domain protein [Onchocerca flexuosa]
MWLTVIFFVSALSKVISQINMSADLNCGFESACQWRNDTVAEDNGDFLIANNVGVGGRFNITPFKNNSDEVFAYTHGPFDGMQKATLISNSISCQIGGGSLTFWYYRTGNSATLEVCVRQPIGSLNIADLRCFPVFPKNRAHQWLFNAVEFPPLTQPFELLIRSNYIQPFDIIAIDDIFYDAALCENTNFLSTEGTGNKSRLFDNLKGDLSDVNGIDSVNKSSSSFLTNGHRKRLFPLHTLPTLRKSISKLPLERTDTQLISPCPFTDCSFDADSMCYYVSDDQLRDDEDLLLDLPSDIILKKWKLSNQKVGNSLTGIMHDISGDGWFAYAGETDNPAAIFLMQMSKAINIPEESRISFYVHMAGKYGRLRVCLDSLQNCPFEKTGQMLTLKTRKWTNFYINISRGIHTIYFVADRLKKNYVIGLDNIQLLIKHDTISAPCA